MHSLVRRYIKTAIAFLGVGLLIGLKMIVERDVLSRPVNAYETSAHTHALLVGFVLLKYRPEDEVQAWLAGGELRIAGLDQPEKETGTWRKSS